MKVEIHLPTTENVGCQRDILDKWIVYLLKYNYHLRSMDDSIQITEQFLLRKILRYEDSSSIKGVVNIRSADLFDTSYVDKSGSKVLKKLHIEVWCFESNYHAKDCAELIRKYKLSGFYDKPPQAYRLNRKEIFYVSTNYEMFRNDLKRAISYVDKRSKTGQAKE
jgi:hypothetical protein